MLNVASTMATTDKPGRIRYLIVFMLFVVTMVNYADRATISIAGPARAVQFCSEWVRGRAKRVYLVGEIA